MFADLYDAVSYLWSFTWPEVTGEVTAVDIENTGKALRLAVAYKFWVNDDGPYTGESFWNPPFNVNRRVMKGRRKVRVGHPVPVRYRADDPSVNRLDRSMWREL